MRYAKRIWVRKVIVWFDGVTVRQVGWQPQGLPLQIPNRILRSGSPRGCHAVRERIVRSFKKGEQLRAFFDLHTLGFQRRLHSGVGFHMLEERLQISHVCDVKVFGPGPAQNRIQIGVGD